MSEVMKNPVQKLWQEQSVEGIKMSAEIIHKRAQKFDRRIWWRNVREYVASLIAACIIAYFFATEHDLFSRLTYALFFGALVWIVVALHRKGSATKIPAGLDTVTSLRMYRAELERQRRVVASAWSWYLAPMVPGFIVLTVGKAIKTPHPAAWASLILMDAIVAATFFGIWKLNMWAARCLQRMIDGLDNGAA